MNKEKINLVELMKDVCINNGKMMLWSGCKPIGCYKHPEQYTSCWVWLSDFIKYLENPVKNKTAWVEDTEENHGMLGEINHSVVKDIKKYYNYQKGG